MTKRDEFRKKTKDILAHRVAWICSWPGCPTVTVGPNKSSTDSFQILGEAAHIHAAAKGGPRYDPNISQEERKSISNGIWLCRQHARLIDNDYKEYSPETLRKWKLSAENAAYKALCLPGDQYLRDTTTLIQIGNDIVFHGKWISADEDKREWSVLVDDYVYGNEFLLKDYCSKYNDRNDKYIVIQDQGDGRIIRVAPSWQLKDTKMYLTVNIEDKFVRTNPYDAGVDLALSPSWDITLDANGDFDLVRGIDSAKQRISTSLSTRYGELLFQPRSGSFFYKYFLDYNENEGLLTSLLKLEVARLASLPDEGRETSPLGFVNRVIDVMFNTFNAIDNKISVLLTIEWGNHEISSDKYSIFVAHEK